MSFMVHDYRKQLHEEHVERRRRLLSKQPTLCLIKAVPGTAYVGDQSEHVASWHIELAVREARAVIAPVVRPSWRNIAREVLEGTNVTMTDLLSARRGHEIVLVRHAVMYRLATETTMSYPQIGRALGNRDPTTIMHGARAHALRNGLPVPSGLRR